MSQDLQHAIAAIHVKVHEIQVQLSLEMGKKKKKTAPQ